MNARDRDLTFQPTAATFEAQQLETRWCVVDVATKTVLTYEWTHSLVQPMRSSRI